MASFTDEIQHYNPYITQLPVDDYVNAGMQLQQRYDTNVQRVQSYIDTVGGIDVAGDANKAYLQNKVTDLEGKVTKIASADFSKNSLVSQVANLSSIIVKDPIVQSGMASAMRLQKYQKSWEDLQKNHPEQYSPKDKEYYDQYVGNYLKKSQTQAGLVYDGPTDAHAHVDYFSKLDKALKDIDPTLTTSISPNGEFQYKIDKSSVVPREKLEGVINTVMASDPNITTQMGIDSWHAYRSFDSKGMYNHINDSYKMMIDQMRSNADYWQGVAKANPNDYQTINMAKDKVKALNDSINQYAQKRDIYLGNINDGNLDQVKQSVFDDSIRAGLMLKHEKNNIDQDIKTNQGAVDARHLYLDYITNGLDPQKGTPLQPGDPLYLAYQRIIESKRKANKKDDGTDEGPDQTVAVAGVVPEKYDQAQHIANMMGLQSTIDQTKGKLRQYYPDMNDEQFSQYMSVQEKKYQDGDATVDPKYAQFKSIIQPTSALLGTYQDITNKINKDAEKAVPGFSVPKSTRFSNIEITEPDGKTRRNDIVADDYVTQAALDVRAKANALSTSHYTSSGSSLPGSTSGGPDWEAGAEKYKNDPQYKYILALAKSSALNDYVKKSGDVGAARVAVTEKGYADFGRTASYKGVPIQGKKDYVDYISRLTATAAGQNGVPIEAENVNPLNYYTNEKGELVVQYQNKKDNKTYTTPVPGNNVLGNPDPYANIARVIDLSPTQSTPLDPKQALSSLNGKIKYVLHKDPLGGQYELRLWHKGQLFTVPSFSINGQSYNAENLGSYVQRVEELSKLAPEDFDKMMAASFSQK